MKRIIFAIILLFCIFLASCPHIPALPSATEAPPSPTPTIIPSPSPTAEPTSTPAISIEQRAVEILDGMTLFEKTCQMLVICIDDVTGRKNETEYGEAFINGIENYPVGGLVFFAENIISSEQVRGMISTAQDTSEIPLFISADEEGGRVRRLSWRLPTATFEPMFNYRAQGEGRAYDNARQIAADMLAHGFNLDFAPVADIWTNPDNTVIGDRAYSNDAAEAAKLVSAAVHGFIDGGIIPTLKHFPGHGDTLLDSHDGPVESDTPLETLRSREFLPFISGLEAGCDIVMLSHVTMTAVDPINPATFSEPVIGGLLRGELGFDGIVTTDSLDMGAIRSFGYDNIALRAIAAGCDILLGIKEIPEVVEAIMENVPESRIDESVLRILELKLESEMIK